MPSSCGCVGISNGLYVMESYLAVFKVEEVLQHFEVCVSENGTRFNDLSSNNWHPPLSSARSN